MVVEHVDSTLCRVGRMHDRLCKELQGRFEKVEADQINKTRRGAGEEAL